MNSKKSILELREYIINNYDKLFYFDEFFNEEELNFKEKDYIYFRKKIDNDNMYKECKKMIEYVKMQENLKKL